VIDDAEPGCLAASAQGGKVVRHEGGVSPRLELLLHTEVNLERATVRGIAAFEPDAAARSKRFGLLDLTETERLDVATTRGLEVLVSGRDGELDVVDSEQAAARTDGFGHDPASSSPGISSRRSRMSIGPSRM